MSAEPTKSLALELAQAHGLAHMRRAGRTQPNVEDRQVLKAEFARLLWHVDVSRGGFLGASDNQSQAIAERFGLDSKTVHHAMLHMGKWPEPQSSMEKAA
jgi:hypothetical protein